MRARSTQFLAKRRSASIRARSRTSRSSVVKLLGRGRVRRRAGRADERPATSGSRCATTRTRPRRTGASRISSRSACSRRRSRAQPVAVRAERAGGAGRATAPSRRTPRPRSSARCGSRRPRCFSRSRIGERFDGDRHRRVGEGHLRAHLHTAGRRDGWCTDRGPRRRRPRARRARADRRRARLHRLRARERDDMTPARSHLRVSDLRGAARLAIDATVGVTNLVRDDAARRDAGSGDARRAEG